MVQVETLMIGDWVEVTLKGEAMPVLVSSVNSAFMSYTTDGENGHIAHSGEMNPIPVTDKVLSQIAEYNEDYGFWALDFYYIKLSDIEGGKLLRIYSDDNALDYGLPFAFCKYVHELQHLLRVIGKAKLADKIRL